MITYKQMQTHNRQKMIIKYVNYSKNLMKKNNKSEKRSDKNDNKRN